MFSSPKATTLRSSAPSFRFKIPPWPSANPGSGTPGDKIRAEIASARGKVLGYITVDQRQSDRRPDTNVFEALELFASQIAIAIENLNYKQMIEAIQQVSVKISRTRDRDALFATIYQQLNTLMYADVMMIRRTCLSVITIIRSR